MTSARHLSQAAAARLVGIARQNVLSAVARGLLDAVPDTDPVQITRASAERYATERAAALAAKKRAAQKAARQKVTKARGA